MNDPWRKFKLQPWRSLLIVAALTTIVASSLDNIIIWILTRSESAIAFFYSLSSSSLGSIIYLAVTVGFGAFSVFICEIIQPEVVLNTSSLWALVLCLIVSLFLKEAISVPSLLLNLSQVFSIGMIVGVFWKGKPYWRYWD
jgi:hypothetical protein